MCNNSIPCCCDHKPSYDKDCTNNCCKKLDWYKCELEKAIDTIEAIYDFADEYLDSLNDCDCCYDRYKYFGCR